MKCVWLLLLCPASLLAAEHDHGAQEVDASVSTEPSPDLADAHAHMLAEHGASLNFLVLGERVEQRDDDTQLWELQGWLGYDRDKMWLKTEGEYDTDANATEHGEVQLLYSRAIAPFWDVQLGLRHDDVGSDARSHVAIGLMGLAPSWFEIDAAAFISDAGDVSTRLEAEYELRFTQRLLLQPRLELNYSFGDDAAMQVGKGMSEASFGLRLRYEWRREFAPYAGVEWARAYGDTATLLRAAGDDSSDTRFVAGVRFWY